MAALPYMPLYVADYLADAAHLSTIEHGAYLLLIMNYWQRGEPLPNDDTRLARIAGLNARDWKRHKATLADFFTIQETHWRHGRIDSELSRVASKSLKSKKAAQASVERRFGERSADVEPTDTDTSKEETLAKANAASGDSTQQFWTNAKIYLKPFVKGDPGSLIGKWVRDHGKPATAEAITRAQLDRAVNPIEFIQGTFRKLATNGYGPGHSGIPL